MWIEGGSRNPFALSNEVVKFVEHTVHIQDVDGERHFVYMPLSAFKKVDERTIPGGRWTSAYKVKTYHPDPERNASMKLSTGDTIRVRVRKGRNSYGTRGVLIGSQGSVIRLN